MMYGSLGTARNKFEKNLLFYHDVTCEKGSKFNRMKYYFELVICRGWKAKTV